MRALARMLQRSPSTISREIERNTAAHAAYGSHVAQQACHARRRAARPAAKRSAFIGRAAKPEQSVGAGRGR
jgi:IS30 family transposase